MARVGSGDGIRLFEVFLEGLFQPGGIAAAVEDQIPAFVKE